MTVQERFDLIAATLRCSRCLATAGQQCRGAAGQALAVPHKERSKAFAKQRRRSFAPVRSKGVRT